jgi:DNA-binding NarL/FixJ family response regulator
MTSAARVVVSFPVRPSTVEALSSALGPDFDVIDIRTAPVGSDLVLCPPLSPGAIRSLKRSFPAAQVVVLLAADGCEPVDRMRDAGADVRTVGTSVEAVASAVRHCVRPPAAEATLMSRRGLAA